ncbi:cytochrome P450 3A21-like [Tropilaelaps mercedesae]|uniref:Cytochrome P450 3A21-like n=1 Tax=Tropilaelaps mercedesae TaxID=418985 RepID=A0A1V9XDQ6_9ACAR|nr:cytochrome P450 3A21-like [Tropilaelaps mercedesae]
MNDHSPPTKACNTMKRIEESILETLRFIPVTFMPDRIYSEDTEVTDVPVKTGTIHTDPPHLPKSEKFLPERFVKDGEVCSKTAAFLISATDEKIALIVVLQSRICR